MNSNVNFRTRRPFSDQFHSRTSKLVSFLLVVVQLLVEVGKIQYKLPFAPQHPFHRWFWMGSCSCSQCSWQLPLELLHQNVVKMNDVVDDGNANDAILVQLTVVDMAVEMLVYRLLVAQIFFDLDFDRKCFILNVFFECFIVCLGFVGYSDHLERSNVNQAQHD